MDQQTRARLRALIDEAKRRQLAELLTSRDLITDKVALERSRQATVDQLPVNHGVSDETVDIGNLYHEATLLVEALRKNLIASAIIDMSNGARTNAVAKACHMTRQNLYKLLKHYPQNDEGLTGEPF